MKAEVYAERITSAFQGGDEAAIREAITEAVRGVAAEGSALFRQRGVKAAPSIARQMDAKWRAIVNRCPPNTLNPNGWRDMMVNREPEFAPLFERRAP